MSAIEGVRALGDRIRAKLSAAVRGREDVIELVTIALLADGHVLLEDYPGSGKTTLARALGEAISASTNELPAFRRVQFTPDLLPSDITGTNIYNAKTQAFDFRRGPLFAHVVLADEINRTSPKVQAALLEAMAEKQVTVDDGTHILDELFFVIATQNPLDVAGTYPLPRPQLDRFLFKIRMGYIEREAEVSVLQRYPETALDASRSLPSVSRDEIVSARQTIRSEVRIAPELREALVDLARRIRADGRVAQGASTRSLLLLLPAMAARAVLRGRSFATPDDVEALAPYVFAHRIETAPGVDDATPVVKEAVAQCMEHLARASIAR